MAGRQALFKVAGSRGGLEGETMHVIERSELVIGNGFPLGGAMIRKERMKGTPECQSARGVETGYANEAAVAWGFKLGGNSQKLITLAALPCKVCPPLLNTNVVWQVWLTG